MDRKCGYVQQDRRGFTESQHLSSWKGPLTITELNSLLLARLPKTKSHDLKHHPDAPWTLSGWYCSHFPGEPVLVMATLLQVKNLTLISSLNLESQKNHRIVWVRSDLQRSTPPAVNSIIFNQICSEPHLLRASSSLALNVSRAFTTSLSNMSQCPPPH